MTTITLDGTTSPAVVLPATHVQANTGDAIDLLGTIDDQGLILADGTGTYTPMTGSGGYTYYVANDGALALVASVVLASPIVVLEGGGTLEFGSEAFDFVYGQTPGYDLLANADTIEGAGVIGVGGTPRVLSDGTAYPIGFVNLAGGVVDATGTLDANHYGGLELDAGANTLVNAGLIEATASGGVFVTAGTLANAGGTVLASGAGDMSNVSADVVSGGTLAASGGGTLYLSSQAVQANGVYMSGPGQVLSGVTFATDAASAVSLDAATLDGTAATVTIMAGSTLVEGGYDTQLVLTGAIADHGTIRLGGGQAGNAVALSGSIDNLGTIVATTGTSGLVSFVLATPTVTLGGGGTLLLAATAGSLTAVTSSDTLAPATLVNLDNLILGAGQIGVAPNSAYGNPVDAVLLDNAANGTVDANDAATALRLYGGTGTLRNAGLMEATAAGGLVIAGAALDNTGGTLLASGAGDTLTLQGLDVTGGLLEDAAGGTIVLSGAATTLESSVTLALGATGTLDVETTTLDLASSFTFSGGSTIRLTGGRIDTGNSAVFVNAGDTIEGALNNQDVAGAIGGAAGALMLVNQAGGVISDVDIELARTGSRNAGLIESTGLYGVTLDIGVSTAVTLDNRGGTILAAGGPVLLGQLDLIGGTLASSAGETIEISATPAAPFVLDGSSGAVTIAAGTTIQTFYTRISLPFVLEYGSAITLLGTIDDLGGTLLGTTTPYGGDPTVNTGLFEGTGAIVGNIVNDGTLLAQGGTLSVSSVSGTGRVEIAAGSTFELGTGDSEAIDFQGVPGTLRFDAPFYNVYASTAMRPNTLGALTDLVVGDTIDLVGQSLASASVMNATTLAIGLVGGTTLDYTLANLQAGAFFSLASATPTPTETYSFNYTGGAGAAEPNYTATGTGSFTVDVGSGTAGLAAVSAFSLSLNVTNNAAGGGTDVIVFSKADLSGFNATFGAGNALTGLSLTTGYGNDTSFDANRGTFYVTNQKLTVTGLGAGGAATNGFDGVDTSGALSVAAPVQQFSALVVASNTPAPTTVLSVAATPATGDFGDGQSIGFVLATSAAVTVTGTPTLALNDGGTASFDAAHSSATALAFTTTVTGLQNAPTLAVVGLVLPTGAAILDGAGQALVTTNAAASFPGLQVDTASAALTQIYRDGLGRAPSAGELASLDQDLAGGTSLSQVRDAIDMSQEGQNALGLVYASVLGRLPSAGELGLLTADEEGGYSLATLRAATAAGSESQNEQMLVTADELGRLPTGAELAVTTQALAGGLSLGGLEAMTAMLPEAQAALAEVYLTTLGRLPTAGEQATLTTDLGEGYTLAQVRGVTAGLPDAQSALTALYQGVLARAPSAAERPFLTAELQGGSTLDEIRTATVQGAEGQDDVAALVATTLGTVPTTAQIADATVQLASGIGQAALAAQLRGLASNPTVSSDAASSTLTGTPGVDLFAVGTGTTDTIAGFDPAHDILQVSRAQVADYAAFAGDLSAAGGGTRLTLDAGHSVLIQGVAPGAIGPANVRFV